MLISERLVCVPPGKARRLLFTVPDMQSLDEFLQKLRADPLAAPLTPQVVAYAERLLKANPGCVIVVRP